MGHFGENFDGVTYLHPKESKGHGFQGSLLSLGAVNTVTYLLSLGAVNTVNYLLSLGAVNTVT